MLSPLFAKTIASIALALLLSPLSARPALALYYSMSMPHFARQMEFYYQKPNPDILPGLLKNFGGGTLLEHAENRLMLAAFLAQLSRNGKISLPDLIKANFSTTRNYRHAMAWAAHLAGLPVTEEISGLLADPMDKNLVRQILRTPASLKAWNPASEKSIIQMYWAAFMATGDPFFIDGIINAACAPLPPGSGHTAQRLATSAAAASIYEFSKRHELVRSMLLERLGKANPREKAILAKMLGN